VSAASRLNRPGQRLTELAVPHDESEEQVGHMGLVAAEWRRDRRIFTLLSNKGRMRGGDGRGWEGMRWDDTWVRNDVG
jgi:hypothetical protein